MSSSQGDSTPKKKALDLFCGSGGASEGLHRAGFEVTGVDIIPQPDYAFEFVLGDALSVPLDGYDFIWASPPCKKHTSLRHLPNVREKDYPNFVTPIRKRLAASGKPYCIENVPDAPLREDLRLCGTMFGLGTADGAAELWRHRIFEIGGFPIPPQPLCKHGERSSVIGIYGNGKGYDRQGRRAGQIHPIPEKRYTQQQCDEAMEIDWMRMDALAQAVPPAYSEYIAEHFLRTQAGKAAATKSAPKRFIETLPSPDSLTTEQLLAAIKDVAAEITSLASRRSAAHREKLLPLLIELKKRLGPKGQFYSTLKKMGLTPSTVRVWHHRSRAADEVIDMLEEQAKEVNPSSENDKESEQDEKGAVRIDRIWAMPNKFTFLIPPIKAFLEEEMDGGPWCDPFAGMHSPASLTNDQHPESNALYHLDALEFLRQQSDGSQQGVLYDPPYSPSQVRDHYDNIGIKHWDGRMNFWSDTKDECGRIIRPGGKAICFGWNSMGMGKSRGFQMTRILLVPHGGSRNDTICTVEIKL